MANITHRKTPNIELVSFDFETHIICGLMVPMLVIQTSFNFSTQLNILRPEKFNHKKLKYKYGSKMVIFALKQFIYGTVNYFKKSVYFPISYNSHSLTHLISIPSINQLSYVFTKIYLKDGTINLPTQKIKNKK